MEKDKERQYGVIIVLMLLAGVLLLFMKEGAVTEDTAIHQKLPVKVGDYIAGERLYCQNEQCGTVFSRIELGDTNACLSCGSDLDLLAVGEKRLFPSDTIVLRKEYTSSTGKKIMVSVVTSGKEQKSIHRPQQCLPAHGYVIERSKTMSVQLKTGREINVMLLDASRNWETLDGLRGRHLASYAYWFVGSERETPYHLKRLFWMSVDRAFRNKSSRWSYINIMVERRSDNQDHEKLIADFIVKLYPLIMLSEKGQ